MLEYKVIFHFFDLSLVINSSKLLDWNHLPAAAIALSTPPTPGAALLRSIMFVLLLGWLLEKILGVFPQKI